MGDVDNQAIEDATLNKALGTPNPGAPRPGFVSRQPGAALPYGAAQPPTPVSGAYNKQTGGRYQAPAPTISPTATVTRPMGSGALSAGDDAGNPGKPVSAGVFDNTPEAVATARSTMGSGPVSSAADATPMLAPGESYPGQNANKAAMNIGNAQNEQRLGDAINFNAAQARHDAAVPDYGQRQRDESAARVAKFRATDGADMVLAGKNRGYDAQRAGIVAAAAGTAGKVAQNNAAVLAPGPQPIQRNVVGEEIAKQGMVTKAGEESAQAANRGLLTQASLASSKVANEGTALDNKQKAAMASATEALSSAKTPEERATAQQNLLALHGKTEPGWHAIQFGGQQIVDPETNQVRTVGGNVMLYNQFTGQKEMHSAQEASGIPAAGGKLPAGAMPHTDAKGNKGYKLPDGKWVDANGKPL